MQADAKTTIHHHLVTPGRLSGPSGDIGDAIFYQRHYLAVAEMQNDGWMAKGLPADFRRIAAANEAKRLRD
jgi:hypothetical protein